MSQRFIALIASGCAVLAALAGAGQSLQAQASDKRAVYVSVLDKDGKPVTDLEANDFELKDRGKTQQIAVKPATVPLRIAILVADWGTGSFQAGVSTFLQKMLGRAEVKLLSLLPQPMTVMDWASDPRSLFNGISAIGSRGRQQGAQVMEGIREATKTIRADGKRGVILVLRIGQDSVSTLAGEDVRGDLRKSGAILDVINLGVRGAASDTPQGGTGMDLSQARLRDEESKTSAFNLQQVLGDGSRESGGRNDQVISTTLVTILSGLADDLLGQYELSYPTQPGAKDGDKISVTTKRKGVTLRAPNHYF